MLVALPENYRLYEHVKKTEQDGQLKVKNKTHAAGGNDRQDAYLYGHPMGRRKRYRSPADFFPHLLWLCTDKEGDPDNCSCKICCPEELENYILAELGISERPYAATPSVIASALKQPSQPATKIRSEAPTPVQRQMVMPQRPQQQQPIMPSPLPPNKSHDQHLDSLYNLYIYRSGEMVWYSRGPAWGLAVVLRRWTASSQHHYQLQPLTHPFGHLPAVTRTGDDALRPWLAWSVPKFSQQALNDRPESLRFDTADWNGMLQGLYGGTRRDMDIDGSILAAKSIDSTYTFLGHASSSETASGGTETCYDGIFIGAEKVWLGDPVRTSLNQGQDIMVVHSILERKHASASVAGSVEFVGDIYTLTSIPHSDPSQPTPASATLNPHLPSRLTEDLASRNLKSIAAYRTARYWRLISPQARLGLNQIKGRWYAASLLMTMLNSINEFQIAAQQGDVQEAGLYMNSRGDCIGANLADGLPKPPRENVPKRKRREAFSNAVPSGTLVRDGEASPDADGHDGSSTTTATRGDVMDIDSRYDAAEEQRSSGGVADAGAETLDEFMNLDGMDDSQGSTMSGYGHHGGGGRYY